MPAYETQAYRYSFTTDWDISAPGVLTLDVRTPRGAFVSWTPTVTGANACHYDADDGELVAGVYQIQAVWRPSGAEDDPQYSPPVTVTVLQRIR